MSYNGYRNDDSGPGPLPNRWLNCPRKSSALIAEKFLAFKTPLSEKFNDQVPEYCRFTPSMLFSSMKSHKVRIGLWIDLTNTSRFYDAKEVREAYGDEKEVKYVKLQCRGHGETPSIDQTRLFVNLCEKFIRENPLEIIGVHCTHGFNRTGFLLAAYMVEVMDCGIEAALQTFAAASCYCGYVQTACRKSLFRFLEAMKYEDQSKEECPTTIGFEILLNINSCEKSAAFNLAMPGIYKGDYIKELFRRYHDEGETYAPPPPPLPSWHSECDDDDNDHDRPPAKRPNHRKHEHDSHDSGGGGSRKKRRELNNKNPVFMEGVPGVTPVLDQPRLREIQTTVQKMCDWEDGGFPGCQPVSMDLNNINLLQKKPYRVSWKADGTRYMMLILKEGEVYCLDRDNSVFQVSGLTFPHRKIPQRHLCDTLIDGEMVIDKHEGKDFPRYLAYDIIKCDGNDVANMQFPVRLKYIEVDIVGPRNKAISEGRIRKEIEPFSIRLKTFWPVEKAGSLLGEKFSKQLSHEPDGLIFQPSNDAYKTGQCMEVLKWKPSSHNSVDFRLKIVLETGEGIVSKKVGHLYVGGLDRPFGSMKVSRTIKELDNKIIECKYDNNSWVFMRERTDKSFPNSYTTAHSVCNTIKNPVTMEWLLSFIERHRYRDEEELAMPPPKQIPRR